MFLKRPLLSLFLITFIVYCSSLFNQFVWDDEQFIYRNSFVQNFNVVSIFTQNTIAGAGENSNYYRPLTTLSFAIDYQFWGLKPFGFHLVNTLLHIGAGLLLFLLLKQLGFEKPIGFVIALIFLLHPLQTEAVTYANSRGDSMYSFFAMISLLSLSWLFERQPPKFLIYEHQFALTKPWLAAISVISLAAAILSKEIGLAVLGLYAWIIMYYFFQTAEKNFPTNIQKFAKEHSLALISFGTNVFVVSGYIWLRATVLNFENTFNFYNDSSIYAQSLLVRLLTFTKIIFIYLRLIFVPSPLHMERNTSELLTPLNLWTPLFLLLILTLGVLSYFQWQRQKRITILFGWGWAAIMLVPVSGIIAINGMLYEHWLYLPLIGFVIAMYGLLEFFCNKFLTSKVVFYLISTILLLFSVLTIRQNYLWGDPIRYYEYILQFTDSARIHNNLAMTYADRQQLNKALEHYQLALNYGQPYPQIYHNMGNTYVALNELDKAEANYKKALELEPQFFHTYPFLIKLYLTEKKYPEALQVADQALAFYPEMPDYQMLKLQVLAASGDTQNFESYKQVLLTLYKTNSTAQRMINSLQLTQE